MSLLIVVLILFPFNLISLIILYSYLNIYQRLNVSVSRSQRIYNQKLQQSKASSLGDLSWSICYSISDNSICLVSLPVLACLCLYVWSNLNILKFFKLECNKFQSCLQHSQETQLFVLIVVNSFFLDPINIFLLKFSQGFFLSISFWRTQKENFNQRFFGPFKNSLRVKVDFQ